MYVLIQYHKKEAPASVETSGGFFTDAIGLHHGVSVNVRNILVHLGHFVNIGSFSCNRCGLGLVIPPYFCTQRLAYSPEWYIGYTVL